MDRRTLGTLLRLIGPLIQVLCLIGLIAPAGPRLPRALLYGGFAVGFVLVLAGNLLPRRPARAEPPGRGGAFSLDPRAPNEDEG